MCIEGNKYELRKLVVACSNMQPDSFIDSLDGDNLQQHGLSRTYLKNTLVRDVPGRLYRLGFEGNLI